MKLENAFKTARDYILESIILLLDCFEYLERTPRRLQYSNFINKLITQNLVKDKKYFDYFFIARTIKKTKSDKLLHRLLSLYPELCIKSIEARVMTFLPPSIPCDRIIRKLKNKLIKNEEYYIHKYIVNNMYPEFTVRSIFVEKKYHRDIRAAWKAARDRALLIYRLAKKKKARFGLLIKKYSDSPCMTPHIIRTLGDGYDIFMAKEKGAICPICQRDNGFFIFQLISTKKRKLDFGSLDYQYYVASDFLSEHNEDALKQIMARGKRHKYCSDWIRSRYLRFDRISKFNINPILSHISEKSNDVIEHISIPFSTIYSSVKGVTPLCLKLDDRIFIIGNAKIDAWEGEHVVKRALLKFIVDADEVQLAKLLLWSQSYKALKNKKHVLFKQIMSRKAKDKISPLIILSVYKESVLEINRKIKSVRAKDCCNLLKKYYEVYLDLFFNYAYHIYEQNIRRLTNGSPTMGKRYQIECFRKLFETIILDMKNRTGGITRSRKYIDRKRKVFRIDTHDEAYYILKRLNTYGSTIIHIDAHKDLWSLSNLATKDGHFGINSSNYLSAIMRDNLCEKIFLVFPDGYNEKECSKICKEHFISDQFYFYSELLRRRKSYSLYVEGREVLVTNLYSLPKSINNAILDIDLDYFICNPLAIREPWIDIGDFINTIRNKNIDVRAIIFSYSIKDGYVSSKFQDYGDQIVKKLNSLL